MDTLSYKTQSATPSTIKREWLVIDAENAVLGRLCAKVATILRGKHKPSFTPHIDTGDFVIIINADKVRLTGNKLLQKEYQRYSGYPGGQKTTIARDLLQKHPIRLVENGVKGMLPKNRLGRAQYGKLFVYAGAEHPHAAQQPKEIKA